MQATIAPPRHDSKLARAVERFCRETFHPPLPELRQKFPTSPRWKAMVAAGSELWLDTGDLEAIAKVWTREFTALTTNNTLLNKEVQKGLYDDLVPRAARVLREADREISADRLVEEIAFILNAVHGLKLVSAFDAHVSVELHTRVALDEEASYQYGKRFQAIQPDRFTVKVPLTAEGIFAARRLVRDGIRVNFTLGFSARQNQLIARVAGPAYVNVFLGRLNSFVADNRLGDGRNVGEKATLASQRTMRRLNAERSTPVRQIAASLRSGEQCRSLTGVDVLTMPVSAAEEYLALEVPPEETRDHTAEDPPVALAEGRTPQKERIDAFWDTGGAFARALAVLEKEDLDALHGDRLREIFRRNGAGDLFPELSPRDRQELSAGGKIPSYEKWKDRVQSGQASWDALLTEAALASFAVDQQKLDERIAKLVR